MLHVKFVYDDDAIDVFMSVDCVCSDACILVVWFYTSKYKNTIFKFIIISKW